MKEIYLGDGAYAKYDGSELVIFIWNGPAILALAEFLQEVKS